MSFNLFKRAIFCNTNNGNSFTMLTTLRSCNLFKGAAVTLKSDPVEK